MDRAYSLLTIKALDAPTRRISGVASTPELDRHGDVMEMAGVTFRNPVPLLFHHRADQPIGTAVLTASASGLTFEATLPHVDEPGALKSRVDEAWQSVKAGVLSGASIGFRVLADGVKQLQNGTRHITAAEVCELSLVTIPANRSASIHLVKALAAPGGCTESRSMTAADQITTLTTKQTAVLAQMDALMSTTATEGRQLTADESTTYDGLLAQSKQLDADVTRWQAHEALMAKSATRVSTTAPGTYSVSVTSNVDPGIRMARYVIAQLASKYTSTDAATYAQQRWGRETPEVALALKAAVAAGTTTDAVWAKPLVNPSITSDFLPLLRANTILGKIPGLRNVPFNVNVPAQTAGGTFGWVGELKPKPVSAMAFSMESLGFNKVAGIVVLSQELVRFSNPSAEAVVRDSMVKDIAAFLDAQFINPAVAAVAGVNPASITNGAPTAAATTNPLADIMGLINHFVAAGLPVDGLTFLMSPQNALALSFRSNLDGSPEFPGITMAGGSYKGITFITSNALTTNVVALQPQYILMADDGGVTIDASTEASLQMDSAPVSPVDATTVLVSMFQMNAVAIRAERYITWKRIGANTVKYLTATAWPSPTGVDVQVSSRATGKDK